MADIAQGQPYSSGIFDVISFMSPTVVVGDIAYFFADDGVHGKELWATDATGAAAHLVVDMCPGSCSSVGIGLMTWQGSLYFFASDGDHAGYGPWRSDGTAAGTVRLADVMVANSIPLSAYKFLALGTYLYFPGADAVHGSELWRTDGSAAGTGIFQDLTPGPGGSSVALLHASPTQIFFSATNGGSSYALWRTDGSPGGTTVVPSISPSILPSRSTLLPGGDLLLSSFPDSGHQEVWRTDGTPAGSSLIKDFGNDGSTSKAFQEWSGLVYFAHDGELWTTDGTGVGTNLLATIPDGGTINSEFMTPAGGLLFFAAATNSQGIELWKSDGTSAGTTVVADLNPGAADGLNDDFWTAFYGDSPRTALPPGSLFFYAKDGVHGLEPWVTDGTAAGTTMLADISPGSGWSSDPFSKPGLLGGKLIFRAFDFPRPTALWGTDGTAAGTQMLVQTNAQSSSLLWPYRAQFAGAAAGLVFPADDHVHGLQVWATDPQGLGAHSLTSLPLDSSVGLLGSIGGRTLYDIGANGVNDHTLLATDGSSTENLMTLSGGFSNLTTFAGSGYFTIQDGSGAALWQTDGTPAGTTLVKAWAGSGSASILAGDGALLWMSVRPASGGSFDLWRSDGTPAGTAFASSLAGYASCVLELADGTLVITQTVSSPNQTNLLALSPAGGLTTLGVFSSWIRACQSDGGRQLLMADDGVHGVEPWVTDGTPSGTALVADVAPGAPSSIDDSASAPIVSDHRFYFLADDGLHGSEPWVSDGTAAGTFVLGDIAPGPPGSRASQPSAAGSKIFFTADDLTHGREIWSTDGSSAGTHLAADVLPGPQSSVPQDLVVVDGLLVFSATDGTHSRELFASDGTPAGTKLVQDIAPGAHPASPTGFAAVGPNMYFYADDATHGFEPWKLPRRALANVIPAALSFYTLSPCRLLDTRSSSPLAANIPVTFGVAGRCGIPATAQAVAINVTTLGATGNGEIAIYPSDDPAPGVALATAVVGRTRAVNAIARISLDDIGQLTALARLSQGELVHLILDVSGYFAP